MSEHPLTKELSGYGPDHLTAALWIARAAPELDRLAEVNAAANAKLKAVERLREKVEKVLQSIRDEAAHIRSKTGGDSLFAGTMIECADLVQAALEGE